MGTSHQAYGVPMSSLLKHKIISKDSLWSTYISFTTLFNCNTWSGLSLSQHHQVYTIKDITGKIGLTSVYNTKITAGRQGSCWASWTTCANRISKFSCLVPRPVASTAFRKFELKKVTHNQIRQNRSCFTDPALLHICYPYYTRCNN